MSQPNPNLLLVEGVEDKRIIPYFMEKFIPWPDDRRLRPVEIKSAGGIEGLFEPGFISAAIKQSGLKSVGMIVDADENPDTRWNQVRNALINWFPEIPQTLPDRGLVCENIDGLRLGIWIMPDNQLAGMMETFLAYCVPDDSKPLWKFVTQHCDVAKKTQGAAFKEAHRDKARIHAYLALQNPPGRQLHDAIKFNILQPQSDVAERFANWFCQVFDLTRNDNGSIDS